MGKILIHRTTASLSHQLQPFAGATKRLYGIVKLLVADTKSVACIAGGGEVEQIMPSENLQRHRLRPIAQQTRHPLLHLVGRHIVGLLDDVGAGVAQRHVAHLGVVVAINKPSSWFYEVYKLGKLFLVYLKCGEHIDMVPLYARDDGHMGFVEMELGPTVDGRSQVLVALNHHHPCRLAQAHHHLKSLQLRPHHIVGLHAAVLQHMQYHGRGGGLAVASANHHARLLPRLLVEVFWIAVNLDSQLLSPQQLRIVLAGMHAQHDGVQLRRDALRMPAVACGQQPIAG